MSPTSHHCLFAGVILLCLFAGVGPVAADSTVFAISSNPAGATVCIDTYQCGITPAAFTENSFTWHSITVSKEGYQSWSRYENTESAGTTAIVANLEPNPPSYGWLELDPSGADVSIDAIYYGNYPQTIPLSPGVHALRLQKPGYYDYPEQITVTAGKTYSNSPVQKPYLKSDGFGDIQVQSVPPGATVWVNDNYMGTTYPDDPVYVTQLPPGTYTVTLAMPDFQPSSENVVVQAGIIHDSTVTMVPSPQGTATAATGQVRIESNPSGAMAYLDNELKGITPTVLAGIPAGSHSLVLRRDGFQDRTATVIITGGSYAGISENMTRVPAPSKPTSTPTKSGLSGIIALAGVAICCALAQQKKNE
jgi:hypothetical protein